MLLNFFNKDLHDSYRRQEDVNFLFPSKENQKYLLLNALLCILGNTYVFPESCALSKSDSL